MAAPPRPSRSTPLPAPLDLSVFRQMADMSNDAFYLCDVTGRFLYVNDRACKYTGYSRDELSRMSVPDFNPEFPPDRFREYMEALEAGTAPTQFETINVAKDGTVMPIELSVARLQVGDGVYTFGVVRDISERKQTETAHHNFTLRILQTLEAERQRVARELHDDVGQAIATVGVLLHTLERTPDAVPPDARPALAATQATIRQITEGVARIVRDYHPAELIGLGLEDTVRTHAREFARRYGLALRLSTSAVAGLLPHEHELHLYRVVQEALANVGRHAAARKVTVRLARERGRVVAVVRDDGVGFAPDPAHTSGLGLVTMRERAELMQAELVIRTRPGAGTEIRLGVPTAERTARGAPPGGPATRRRGAPTRAQPNPALRRARRKARRA